MQTGKALDLYRAPKDILAARTFSDLNELAARIEQGSAATPLGRFAANGLADGAEAIVCVRQSGVRLLAPGQGVPARVLDARFLGDVALVEVAVQGLDAPILARVKESDVPPQGAEIGVGVDQRRGAGVRGRATATGLPLEAVGAMRSTAPGLRAGRRFAAIVPAEPKARAMASARVGDRSWD